MRYCIFLDESGCLGFNFSKESTSNYFTICLLVVSGSDSVKQINKAVERTIKNKLRGKKNKNSFVELKGSKDALSVKSYFYDQIKKNDPEFQIYALTLNKERVNDELKKVPHRLYNYLIGKLLEKLELSLDISELNFVLDKCKSPKEIREANSYLYSLLASRLDPKIKMTFVHQESHNDHCLSATDYFCHGIFRKYERKDTIWYHIFREKIKYDEVFLPN